MNQELKPFILLSEDGSITAVLQTNEKGFKKSIENGRIWAVNPETLRLLPEDRFGSPAALHEGGASGSGWYEAVVPSEGGRPPRQEPPAEIGNTAAPAYETGTGSGTDIIERLFNVIEARKKELPEGSYTTHLFNSGLSKIKKKTGEEAVELLLAEDRGEIIYEAADLIYHMLVLLAAADINPAEIFNELKSRE